MDPARFGLVLDPLFERHDTGPGHPERPDRLRRLRETLERSRVVDGVVRLSPTRATDEQLTACHDRAHVERIDEACRRGEPFVDSMDCAIGAESADVARAAAGSLVDLCTRVASGALDRGFAAVRPPGHHAERDLAMGFCLFNNVAVAAAALRRTCGLSRVMILDWDVHHGNGTQHLFEEDPDVLFCSLHQMPLYPGTGAPDERGVGAGEGTTLNCPLPPGAGDEAFLGAIRDRMVPAARAFAPEMILVSAGFDAHRSDPIGGLEVTTEAYGVATRELCALADELCAGRLVSVLEGGYDLDALAASALLHVRTMLES